MAAGCKDPRRVEPTVPLQPSVADMQKHCEDFALAARNDASAAKAMAEYHEEMAQLIRESR
jgi:hypothetical protein